MVNAVGGGLLVGFHCSYCDKVADGAKNSVIVPDQLNLDFIVSLFLWCWNWHWIVGVGIHSVCSWCLYFFFFWVGGFFFKKVYGFLC